MPAGPRKAVERHNGRIYWVTRDAALGLARLCPPGRILGTQTFRAAGVFAIFYTHFSGCRHRRILPTQFFRVAVTVAVAFYPHTPFGWPGFCILPTQTFSVTGDCILPTHTLSGRFVSKIEKHEFNFEIFSSRCARPFSYTIHKQMRYILEKHFRAARALFLTQSMSE